MTLEFAAKGPKRVRDRIRHHHIRLRTRRAIPRNVQQPPQGVPVVQEGCPVRSGFWATPGERLADLEPELLPIRAYLNGGEKKRSL